MPNADGPQPGRHGRVRTATVRVEEHVVPRSGTGTLGVEEEFLVISPSSRLVVPEGPRVVGRATPVLGSAVSGEFTLYQVETRTRPCRDGTEVSAELARLRCAATRAARAEGLRLCASGTPILGGTDPGAIADHPRYRAEADQYRTLLGDFAVCACHVHVGVPGREQAVLVSNHLRPWLPLLVAMSANSPFHQGRDTGYASWRTAIRGRFPCLGPPPYASSMAEYERMAEAMTATGAMLAPDLPLWDVRPSPRYPTVEIRAMDVLPETQDTVALALLLRALVLTALERVEHGDAGPEVPGELVRAGCWRAARDGWLGHAPDPETWQAVRCAPLAGRLVRRMRSVLEARGDEDAVSGLIERLKARGDGSVAQRRAARSGGPPAVVDMVTARTEQAAQPGAVERRAAEKPG
ncbi:carboxylate-amine ligase [Streptomyces sp. NPDC002758]